MPINPIETLWSQAQAPGTHEGKRISKAEADLMVAEIANGGITQAEVEVVDQIVKAATASAVQAAADAELHNLEFDMAGQANVRGAGASTTLNDIMQMQQEMKALEANRNSSSAKAKHEAHLLSAVGFIRQQVELARRVPVIVEQLSYGPLDWKVPDAEAREALGQIEAAGVYGSVVIRHFIKQGGGRFLERLAEELPKAGKQRLRTLLKGLNTEIQAEVMKTIGRDLWNDVMKS